MGKKKPENFIPAKDWPKGHKWHKSGRKRCTSWAYGQGRQCEKQAKDGMNKCPTHGGASLKGAAAPSYKHGKFSKYAPAGIAARIEEHVRDPELLNLTEDIAIWNARIELLIQELNGSGGPEAWLQLEVLYTDLVNAIREQNTSEIAKNLNGIGDLIQIAQSDYRTWNRIAGAQEHKIRIVGAEHKRRVDMQLLLDKTHLMLILDQVYNIFVWSLERNIKDEQLRRRVTSDTSSGIRGLVSGNISG